MPFGLINTPSTFQTTMNRVFPPYLRKFVIVFFDDILVYSRSLTEHLNHLKIVFQSLLDTQLFSNLKKCQFCFDEGRNVTDLTTKEMHKEEEVESGTVIDGNIGSVKRRQTWMKEYQM